MILSNDGFDAFHYRSYGTFFLHKIGSIISIGDLPTTNIIEPIKHCPPRNIDLFRYKKGWKIIPSFFYFNNILQIKSYSHLLKMIWWGR